MQKSPKTQRPKQSQIERPTDFKNHRPQDLKIPKPKDQLTHKLKEPQKTHRPTDATTLQTLAVAIISKVKKALGDAHVDLIVNGVKLLKDSSIEESSQFRFN